MRIALAAIAALAMPVSAAAPVKRVPAKATAPAKRAPIDWTRRFARTADGNFVQGNPAAKVKLVVYLSLTCPHCAHFEAEAAAPLAARYIRAGRVSFEVRHAIRDPFDMAATILARCAGPAGFFAVAPALFATQAEWTAKGSAWVRTAPDLASLGPAQSLTRIAQGAGLDAFFRARGLGEKRMASCLADVPEEERLARAADAIWQLPGFPGTPAIAINGAPVSNISNWAELDRRLAEATG